VEAWVSELEMQPHQRGTTWAESLQTFRLEEGLRRNIEMEDDYKITLIRYKYEFHQKFMKFRLFSN